jgi:glycosyltransferase involved in cell wall biosynthesis
VTLAATRIERAPAGISCVEFNHHDPRTLVPHLEGVDVVVCQPQWPLTMRALRRSGAQLVFDLYTPDPLETLEYLSTRPAPLRNLIGGLTVDRVIEAFRIGHHFLCASESQRDLWLGAMLAERMVGTQAYDRDPSFESVISVVPMGVPDDPPQSHPDAGIRAHFPQIEASDRLVLWNGGLWNWLDPETAIRGAAIALQEEPRMKLVFMGASHQPAGQRAARDARRVAADLGLNNGTVLFNDSWVPYAGRATWLLEADCAVSCHTVHLETRFAFRTRLLDCFWAGLPVVCTGGDALAQEIDRRDLGVVVRQKDAEGVAAGLLQVLQNGKTSYEARLRETAQSYRWSQVAEPLVEVVIGAPRERLGQGRRRRPTHSMRNAGYSGVRTVLNAVGLAGSGFGVRRT